MVRISGWTVGTDPVRNFVEAVDYRYLPALELLKLLFTIVVSGSSCLLEMQRQKRVRSEALYPELVQFLLMLCIALSTEL